MPHIDSKYLMGMAPSGPMPMIMSGVQPPRPKPAMPPPPKPEPAASKRSERLGIPRLSIRNHNVDPDTVIEHLFGRELHVDEHSGVCDLINPRNPNGRMVSYPTAGIHTTG